MLSRAHRSLREHHINEAASISVSQRSFFTFSRCIFCCGRAMSLEHYVGTNYFDSIRAQGYAVPLSILLMTGLSILWFLKKPKLRLPPGPVGFPFIGYVPFLGKESYKTLNDLSRKYGNVFSLYLGRKYVVVLGDYSAVKEAFSNKASLHRPPGIFDFMPDGFGISNSNGETWVQNKRFILKTMKDLGLGRNAWELLVEEEVAEFLEVIASTKGEPVDLGTPLASSVSNNITSLLFGKRLPPGPKRDMLNSGIEAVRLFFRQDGPWNYFPWLCSILVKLKICNYHELFSKMNDLNIFVRKETEIHRKSRDYTKGTDFVSRFLQEIEANRGETNDTIFNEKNLIANSQSLFTAGSDTVKAALLWLFLAMTTYPDIQQNVHLELDAVGGRQRKLSWQDRFRLPYTYAVILETQRWRTLAPLNLARMASEDFKLFEYDVPKGSIILANLWALHNDPRYWKDPEKFIPDRFLQNEGKEINLNVESYEPFSYGKRQCPGKTVGLMEIFLYFASIMQQFEILAPNGGKPNLDAIVGITYIPVERTFCFIPR